jgi:hypothetical protein
MDELTRTIPGWGVDREPWQRPGVPMLRDPRPAPGSHIEPASQVPHERELDHLTTVFGTAAPPRGLSGLVRRFAYRVPEHRARRWMMLLFADRVDALEYRLVQPSGLVISGLVVVAGVVLGRRIWRRGGLVKRVPRTVRRPLKP